MNILQNDIYIPEQQQIVALVRKVLLEKKLENSLDGFKLDKTAIDKEAIQQHLNSIFKLLGFNLEDPSLANSDQRVAKMWVEESFKGLNYANFPEIMLVANDINYQDLLVIDNIPFYSTCEHHLQTIQGKCFIAYRPRHLLMGLSKFNRIVEFFAARPQLQERLTMQIAVTLETILGTSVAVVTSATHNCIKCRGVKDEYSATSCYYGAEYLKPEDYEIFIAKYNSSLQRYPLV